MSTLIGDGAPSSVQQAARRLSETYNSLHRYDEVAIRRSLELFSTHLPSTGPSLVLDIGCGTGFTAEILAGAEQEVVALDVSIDMVMTLRRRKHKHWLRTVVADARFIPLRDESVDGALFVESLHLMSPPERALAEARRVLKAQGTLLIVTTLRHHLQKQLYHQLFPQYHAFDEKRHLDLDQIVDAASSNGLRVVSTESFSHHRVFADAAAFVRFVETKPFFGLQQLPESQFRDGIAQLARVARARFPTGQVINESVLTALVLKKPETE